jgi:CheY-like chemotaxis protein
MRKRVLVAEDYEDIRRMMKILLECRGYEVLEAADGFEAVKKAVSDNPDLILMDIAMPVMDGLQATEAIRQHEDLAGIPIVAVTAYGDFYGEKAIDVGCNDVIQKPLDFSRLGPIMESYISGTVTNGAQAH